MSTTTNGVSELDADYWDARARRFAATGQGYRAVCSFGMPGFYNWAINRAQKAALAPWLRADANTRVLDVGCGVGRWSRMAAAQGAHTLGVDLSPTMVAEATARAREDGVADLCRFQVGDASTLVLEEQFDLIVCVTVLQHIVQPAQRREAVRKIAEHLDENGRVVLLEAAPVRPCRSNDHARFSPWTLDQHVELFNEAGLRVKAVTGVDAAIPRKWVLPLYAGVPRPVGVALLAAATLATLPYEVVLARRMPSWSWHQLFVLGKG